MPVITKYKLPHATTIRLEAVWTVRIAFVRYAQKIIRDLLKLLKPELRGAFAASYTGKSGYEAKVIFFSMEETDPEENWPDW